VKITTFNSRPVRHVRHMPDGTVVLRLYEDLTGAALDRLAYGDIFSSPTARAFACNSLEGGSHCLTH